MRLIIALLTAALSVPGIGAAQQARPSHCISLVQNTPGIEYVHRASVGAPLPRYTVRIHFIGHAMFMVETEDGQSAVTDYTGYIGNDAIVPDVVTMNHAHSSHWTPSPDPRIPNVLRGWTEDQSPADHYLQLGELVVRSVSTDIRSYGRREENGNSIFVFEAAGLCIGHLGHLHHEPTEEQYAALGRIDVVMAPVDGGYTMNVDTMVDVLQRLRSSVVIPMHWFGQATLERFLARIEEDFVVDRTGGPMIEMSLQTLPERPTVMVLDPAFLE